MTRAQATRLDLAGFPALGRLLRWPPLLFLVRLPLVILFAGVVLAGLLGVQSPGRNLATITVWTVWWAALPFLALGFGKLWCAVCPWQERARGQRGRQPAPGRLGASRAAEGAAGRGVAGPDAGRAHHVPRPRHDSLVGPDRGRRRRLGRPRAHRGLHDPHGRRGGSANRRIRRGSRPGAPLGRSGCGRCPSRALRPIRLRPPAGRLLLSPGPQRRAPLPRRRRAAARPLGPARLGVESLRDRGPAPRSPSHGPGSSRRAGGLPGGGSGLRRADDRARGAPAVRRRPAGAGAGARAGVQPDPLRRQSMAAGPADGDADRPVAPGRGERDRMAAPTRMRRWAAAAGVALLCAATAATASAPLTVHTEGLSIGLTTTPSPPVRGEGTAFEISVADAAGAPQAGA